MYTHQVSLVIFQNHATLLALLWVHRLESALMSMPPHQVSLVMSQNHATLLALLWVHRLESAPIGRKYDLTIFLVSNLISMPHQNGSRLSESNKF